MMKKIISGLVFAICSFAHAQVPPAKAQPPPNVVSYSEIDALTNEMDNVVNARDKKSLTLKKINALCEKVTSLEKSLSTKSPNAAISNAYYAQALGEHVNKLKQVNRQSDSREMVKYYGSDYRKKVSNEINILNQELQIAKRKAGASYPTMSGFAPLSDHQRKSLAVFYDLRSGCQNNAGSSARGSSFDPVVKAAGWAQVMDEAMGIKFGAGDSKSPKGTN